jgi:methyl-accepting chemotaxis protein
LSITVPYTTPRKVYAVLVGLLGWALLLTGLSVAFPSLSDWGYILALSALGVLLGAVGASLPGGINVGLEATAYYAAMLSLSPWAAGFVAVWPIFAHHRWRGAMTGWALWRNTGMYALMAVAGGYTYRWAGGETPLTHLSLISLVALALAVVAVRLVNEIILFGSTLVYLGGGAAIAHMRQTQAPGWGAEALAYLPALLTALIYHGLGPGALAIWLALLSAGALALYGLARARTEVTRRLAELSAANARMSEHNDREAEMAVQLSRASEELAGYASRLAAALHQQHTAATQITSTVEELAQQSHYIAEAAGAVDTTSEAALVSAGRGQQAAAGSVDAMADLERNVRAMNDRMNTLEGRSRLIHRTLQTINNIAGETHLLALNATIEAAGAGDQGRRFSVVAQQINGLADQALRAAGEIQVTVREIEAATADTKGVIEQGLAETRRYTGQVDEARQSMEVILNAVGRASDMAQQIRLATEQQMQASNQVTQAMREIASSMGSASTEGSAVYDAAENLRRMAEDLRRLDDRAHGAGAAAGRPAGA